jgi:hypothetical protein
MFVVLIMTCFVLGIIIGLNAVDEDLKKNQAKYINTYYTVTTDKKEYKHVNMLNLNYYKGGATCNFNDNGQEVTVCGEFIVTKEKIAEKTNE